MEVNIVEQLFPNGLTVLTQLCSTLVLFLVAKHFLWASVKKFLDARADKMQEEIETERREMYASMKKEMVDVAFSAAGKLIGEHEGEKVDRQAIDAFVKEAVGDGE